MGIEVFPVLAEYHHKKAEIKRLILIRVLGYVSKFSYTVIYTPFPDSNCDILEAQ